MPSAQAQRNAEVVRAYYDAYNRRDYTTCASLAADTVEWVYPATGESFPGRDGLCRHLQNWVAAFPDAQIADIKTLVAGDDAVAVEFVGRGTFTGPLKTPAGELPPTGRAAEHAFCEVIHFQDGKMIGGHLYFDVVSLLSKLGLMPEPRESHANEPALTLR